MGPIGQEQQDLFDSELENIVAFDFVYSLASTNINQSAPNLVTMYMSVKSQKSLIMGQVISDQSVLSALEIEIYELQLSIWYLSSLLTCTAKYSGERYRTIMVLLFNLVVESFIY